MITAFEYNPSQVRIETKAGGIHTGNLVKEDGHFRTTPNSAGWTTICFGNTRIIDALTSIVQPVIYNIAAEYGKAPSANLVTEIVRHIIKEDFPELQMFD